MEANSFNLNYLDFVSAVPLPEPEPEPQPINQAPAASAGGDQNVTLPNSVTVNGSAADVGTQITLPSGALLTLNADGSYVYDTNGQFEALQVGETATDDFIYTVTDGQGSSASATVTITIDGVNDVPLANNDVGATDEDTVLNVSVDGVLANDTDVDPNDTKTVTAVEGLAVEIDQAKQ